MTPVTVRVRAREIELVCGKDRREERRFGPNHHYE